MAQRFDALRFKKYSRFCGRCGEIFPTKSRAGRICRRCSKNGRSSEII